MMTWRMLCAVVLRATFGVVVLAAWCVAPLAIAQSEDEDGDAPKKKRSAVMVLESTDSQDGEGGHAAAQAFMVTVGPDGGSSVQMFKMQDGKMVPVESDGHMTFVTDGGGFGPRVFGRPGLMGSRFSEFKEDHPTADADEDGSISFQEMRAFRVAKVMSNSDAVMAQFPHADGNGDGTLDVDEAAQLAGPGLMHPPSLMMPRILVGVDSPEARIEIREVDGEEMGDSFDLTLEAANVEIEFGVGAPHQIKIATSRIVRDADGKRQTEIVQTIGEDGVSEMTLTVDGEELYHGPPPAAWLDEADLIEPTREEVAEHMVLLEEADSARFLEMHPEADEDGDGAISEEERQALQTSFMSRMLESHDWSSEMHEDGTFEMSDHHRAIVEEMLSQLESAGADDPNALKEIAEALARVRESHGDVEASAKLTKGKDLWVAIKEAFVRKHDFPKEAIELADEVCDAAIEVRDKIIEQIDAIKTEHADVLEAEGESETEPVDDLEEAKEEGDREGEKKAESKPAKLIKRLRAKIEDIKQRRLIGGLKKIREKIVR